MEFLNFKIYKSNNELKSVCDELKNNSIQYIVDHNGNSLDSNFGNNTFNSDIILKIKKVDFLKANQIIEKLKESEMSIGLNKDHFLFNFSNEELIDVIKKRDEWGDDNYALAKVILKERGNDLNGEFLSELQKERIKELSIPEPNNESIPKVIGYISGFFAGPLGFFIGYHLLNFKKTLPNGETVFYYSENDRKHGRRIIFIGLISSIIIVLIKIFK